MATAGGGGGVFVCVWGGGGYVMKALVVVPLIGFTDCDDCLQAGRIYRRWACLNRDSKTEGNGSDLTGVRFQR